jgi:MFS family permease
LQALGLAPSATVVSISLLAAASTVGRLLAGLLGDRIDPRRVWSVALLMILAGCLVILNARTLISVVIYATLVGTGFGAAYVSRLAAIGHYFGAAAFASINGLLSPILTVFNSLTPFLGGLVYDALGSYALAFIGASAIAGGGIVCLLLIKSPVRHRPRGG